MVKANSPTRIESVSALPSVWDLPADLQWMVEGAISVGTVNLLSAESGTGKSWIAYAIAGAVASGMPFAGLNVRQSSVIYVDGENPLAVVKDRVRELGLSESADLKVWGGWIEDPPPGPDDPRIIDFARNRKGLLIWDSLVEFNPGDELNATETRAFMKKFRALSNLGATVLVLHHCGKSSTSSEYRGSSDIKAGVDTAYKLETVQLRGGKIHLLRMNNFKSRTAPGQNFGLEFHAGEGFKRLELTGPGLKDVASLLTAIIEDQGELNGTELKQLARDRHQIAKHQVDEFLSRWEYYRKGKGREIRYFAKPLPKAA
jgi:archaellum biogenesis ATPase FlaH